MSCSSVNERPALFIVGSFHELDAISKWIIGVKTMIAFQCSPIDRSVACSIQTATQSVEIVDHKGGVGFLRWYEVGIDSQVQFDISSLEPSTASLGQRGWFPDFAKAEQSPIKSAGFTFASSGHGQLQMIDALDQGLCQQLSDQPSY